jgi:phage/plasmid-like protein (TIGR03299 family)
MPANIGEMFYFGEIPWHGKGIEVEALLEVESALKTAGLDWQVTSMDLQTAEDPPSPASSRRAIVRTDRQPGDPGRVVGVVHPGFHPLQNRDAATIFDSLFGHGEPVYHTGGYLNDGQVVWLMAKLNRRLSIGNKDDVEPYALMVNSHDGSYPFSLSLTTIRVVCQNTINFALRERDVPKFRRAHKGTPKMHKEAAAAFWQLVLGQLDRYEKEFQQLTLRPCSVENVEQALEKLFPLPKPLGPNPTSLQKRAHETRLESVRQIRTKVAMLRESGAGAELATARGTFWGLLNAITEYVDHHHDYEGSRLAYSLLGRGSEIKAKAYRVIHEIANPPA